jgi:putative ABC transport system permease protein
MVAVGSGAQTRVEEQIRSLGSNLIIVISGSITASGVRLGTGSQLTITEDDARAMEREIEAIQVAAPVVRGGAQVIAGNANWSTGVYGVTPGFLDARDWPAVIGHPLAQEDVDGATKVALLGQTVAQNLFGAADPIGQTIRIKKVPFTVVGVLLGTSQANARAVGTILVKILEASAMKPAEGEIRALLRQRHRLQPDQDDDFTLRNLSELLESQEAASRVLSLLLAAIASVSLVVGGIGIMNIMLVSVTERTREIGLRRAVGARRWDILVPHRGSDRLARRRGDRHRARDPRLLVDRLLRRMPRADPRDGGRARVRVRRGRRCLLRLLPSPARLPPESY